MSGAVQQGPNIRLVPPGDVHHQHAYRHTQTGQPCPVHALDNNGACIREQQEGVTAAGNKRHRPAGGFSNGVKMDGQIGGLTAAFHQEEPIKQRSTRLCVCVRERELTGALAPTAAV